MTEPIHLDAASRAFYQGVAAGAEASEQLPATASHQQQQALFWFTVGRRYVRDAIEAARAENYILGAAMRQPEEHHALSITLSAASLSAALSGQQPERSGRPGASEELEVDWRALEEAARVEVSRIIAVLAQHLREGEISGPLTTSSGTVVGSFSFDLDHL